MLQRWQAVGNTVSDLIGPRFDPLTSSSRDERVTARPTGRLSSNVVYKIYRSFLRNQNTIIVLVKKHQFLSAWQWHPFFSALAML